MRNIAKHKSFLCFLLILSLVLPLVPVTESKAFEHTGVLVVKNRGNAKNAREWGGKSLDTSIAEKLIANATLVWSIENCASIDKKVKYNGVAAGATADNGTVKCYYGDLTDGTKVMYYATYLGDSLKHVFYHEESDFSARTLWTALDGLSIGFWDTSNVGVGFYTYAKSFHSNSYTINYSGLYAIMCGEPSKSPLLYVAMHGLGLSEFNYSEFKYEEKQVGQDIFELLIDQTLLAKETGKHDSITLANKDSELQVLYGSEDITEKIKGSSKINFGDEEVSLGFPKLAKAISENATTLSKYYAASQNQATDKDLQSYATVYDYYAARLAGFDGSDNKANELNAFPSTPLGVPDGTKGLAEEEKLRLKVFASILAKGGSNKSSVKNFLTAEYVDVTANNSNNTTSTSGGDENAPDNLLGGIVQGVGNLINGAVDKAKDVYSKIQQDRYNKLVVPIKVLGANPEWQWQPSTPIGEISIADNSSAHSLADLVEQANALYEGRYSEYSAQANPTPELECTNAYAVAIYYAAIMYGAETTTGSVEGYRQIHKMDYIESVTVKKDDSVSVGNIDFSYKKDDGTLSYHGIPAMTRINYIADTEDARNAYYNLNQLIMVIASFCNENEKQYQESTSAWFKTLKNIEDKANIANTEAISTLKKNINLVRSAINIKKTLDYLGVDITWIPAVKTVCDAGNALNDYDSVVLDMNVAYEANESEPMNTFFNLSEGKFSDDYLIGVALSATFRPMSTNMYDVQSVSFIEDSDWVTRFHYPWGFYRKALYIDTDSNAAVNHYIKNTAKGTSQVATLGDLLQPEKDVVLYVDDRYYNVDKLAAAYNIAYNKIQNTSVEESEVKGTEDVGVFDTINNWVEDAANMDVESIVKTGGNTAYSKFAYDHVAHIDEDGDKDDSLISKINRLPILNLDQIKYQLTGYSDDPTDDYAQQYSVAQSFAVVSAIYRDPTLYSIVSSLTGKSPAVFVSSPKLFAMEGVSAEAFNSIYNYAMLKNLKDILPLDYKSQLDLTEPLYMDIYGNILTDSGLVVIPAMSNATLCSSDYTPATVGFLYLYNYGNYQIPSTANNCDFMLSDYFAADDNTHTYRLTNKIFDNVKLNLSAIQLNDEGVIKMLYECAIDNCYTSGYIPFNKHVYWMTEVLRGAPLEFVDKDKEMIITTTSYSKLGITIANKLDEIVQSFYEGDTKLSILSLPNLAFMNGFEYVILYLFKIVFVALFLMLAYRLYTDAVSGTLGIKSVVSFIASVVMFLFTCFAVPTLLDLSYYQVNKKLLQSESLQTVMLDAEKRAEGREIGVTGVQSVENKSKLYLKVDDLSIPWYAILDDVLLNNTADTLDALYAEEFENSSLANLPRFTRQGQNLYIDVNAVMDNSVITFDPDEKTVLSIVNETPYESYITPYYAVLDVLIGKINSYNLANNINSFEKKIMSGGQVKTVGIITPYLTSNEFMSISQDPSGFRDIYGLDTTYYETSILDDEDHYAMESSYWYVDTGSIKSDVLEKDLSEIENEARNFVAEHRSLLNKISDESFLEAMALDIACKHNSVFRIGNADTIEIFDVDATDIIRMSIAPMAKVTSQCSKSFARFVYDNGGTLGTVSTAFLLFTYIIGSILKPVCLCIMIVCLFMSVVIRRLIKKDNDSAMEGYLITMAVMCIANILFSLVFKVSMFLPDIGMGMAASALIQIALQVLYCMALVGLTTIVVKDWKNAGYDTYLSVAYRLSARVQNAVLHTERQVVNTGKQTINSASTELNGRLNDFIDTFDEDHPHGDWRQAFNNSNRNRKSNSHSYGSGNNFRDIQKMREANVSTNELLNAMKANDEERRQHAKRK